MEYLNTIFEQNGVVYAVCSHKVPSKDLARFIVTELHYMDKIPGARMRTVTNDEVKALPFGAPDYPGQKKNKRC